MKISQLKAQEWNLTWWSGHVVDVVDGVRTAGLFPPRSISFLPHNLPDLYMANTVTGISDMLYSLNTITLGKFYGEHLCITGIKCEGDDVYGM